MNEQPVPLEHHQPLPQPPAPAPASVHQPTLTAADETASVPVVKVLSTRGVEYGMMSISLWFAAAALIWMLLAIVSGDSGFDILAFPSAVLLTSLPVFGWLFLRLRRAELANPQLRVEPSKRRFSQLTQFLAFFAVFFNLIGFVYTILAVVGGDSEDSIGKAAVRCIVVLSVAGGVFVYYWADEHRTRR